MRKIINIFFLVLFINFLGLPPVISVMTEGKLCSINITNEEEESRKSTSNWFEEEIKETKYLHCTSHFKLSADDVEESLFSFAEKYVSYKDLVNKIPVPPPEFI